ncbi:MarR family transcriptional regulator [soil metagenome]
MITSRANAGELDDAELFAWRSFVETITDLMSAIEGGVSGHGLTLGDYQVLVFLSEAPAGSLRMRDLAERLQLSPSGLTRRLDGLVRGGYVERRPSSDDRRAMLGVLTDQGWAKLVEAYPDHLASVRQHVIAPLTRRDVVSMGRIFSAIQGALRNDSADADDADNSVTVNGAA